MKEKFEPFKELLKALREIKYAIGCKNDGSGNGSDIVLPKYIFGGNTDRFTQLTVYKLFEIDYDGKLMNNLMMVETGEVENLSEEELINFREYLQNHTINPISLDYTKQWNGNILYLYTKEQTDVINKNSIIQLFDGTTTKSDDSKIIDIVDMMEEEPIDISNYAQRGQYYCIILKAQYDKLFNTPTFPTEPILGPGTVA